MANLLGLRLTSLPKLFLQGYYLFILLLFSVTIPPCSALFSVERNFCKDIILDSMCISLSGGILMVPQKHREASKFIYNSGFYITGVTGKLRFFLINQYIFEVDLVHMQHVANLLRQRSTVEHW